MNNDIYICFTYYHLFIALVKTMINKESSSSIILASDNYNNQLVGDDNLKKRLNELKIFNKIYLFDFSDKQKHILESKKFIALKKFLLLRYVIKNYDFEFYTFNNIYIFNDKTLIGRVIDKKNIKFYLLEDGLNCYKKNYNQIKEKNSIKKLIKKNFFKIGNMGESKNIISIEVNDASEVKGIDKKIVEQSRSKMINSLTEEEKKIIKKVFLGEDDFRFPPNASIILTQPLYEDGFLKSEDEQITLYKDIIEEYNLENIIIKVHPRDKIDYNKYIKNVSVISKVFPIEILLFNKNLHIQNVITISSTSIDEINFAKNKYFLGWDWLERKVKEYESK